MSDYGSKVTLLALTLPVALGGDEGKGLSKVDSAEDLIEWAGRLCYNSEHATGSNPDWIQARMKAGHVSILEHASASFYICCSRVVSHEVVRHRLASYSQRSQRYVEEHEKRYVTPPELQHIPEGVGFKDAMDMCWQVYRDLVGQGVKPEIARYVLPGACQTELVKTMNFRELLHFIRLRTSSAALPEMREVAGKVRDICKDFAPEVFRDA